MQSKHIFTSYFPPDFFTALNILLRMDLVTYVLDVVNVIVTRLVQDLIHVMQTLVNVIVIMGFKA